MSPENEKNLGEGKKDLEELASRVDSGASANLESKEIGVEDSDTSDLSLVDVDTKPPFLDKDGQKIIEIPKDVTIKSTMREVTPKFSDDSFAERIIEFTTADKSDGAARDARVYGDETETFWSDRVNESKSIN